MPPRASRCTSSLGHTTSGYLEENICSIGPTHFASTADSLPRHLGTFRHTHGQRSGHSSDRVRVVHVHIPLSPPTAHKCHRYHALLASPKIVLSIWKVLGGLSSRVSCREPLSYPPPMRGISRPRLTRYMYPSPPSAQESYQLNPVEEPFWLRSACSSKDTPVLPMTKKWRTRGGHGGSVQYALKHSNSGTHACFL